MANLHVSSSEIDSFISPDYWESISEMRLPLKSILTFKRVHSTNGWYEMRIKDDNGNFEFHYGKPRNKIGVKSSIRLTFRELEQLKDSDVQSFGVFVLFQHTFFVDPRFRGSYFNPEPRLKAYKRAGEIRSVDDSNSWFEMTTEDEFGTSYHYGKPGELAGTTSSRRLTLLELGQLGVSDMPELEQFCQMQAMLLSQIGPKDVFGNVYRSEAENFSKELFVLNEILGQIRISSTQEHIKNGDEAQYLRNIYKIEYLRICSTLSHLTSLLREGFIDPVEAVSDVQRIKSEIGMLETASGNEYLQISVSLNNFNSELMKKDPCSVNILKREWESDSLCQGSFELPVKRHQVGKP